MIPIDKQKHILAGLVAGIIAAAIFPEWWAPVVAAAVLGAAKEIFDWCWNRWVRPEHTVDVWDAVATAAGGILPTLYRLLF